MKYLFTIVITFKNKEQIIWQYEERTPRDAFIQFVRYHDTLDGHNREAIEATLSNLFESPHDRGVWIIHGNESTHIEKGIVIRTDKDAYLRPLHH